MELTDQQVIDLFTRLGRIEEKIERAPAACAVHGEQIRNLGERMDWVEDKLASVQTVIGKKELLVAVFGAVGVGIGFAIKAAVGLLK